MTLRDLPVQTLTGETTTLGALAGGRSALVVNVASRCGLTPQYAALERLHETRDDLVVIGVPCNQVHQCEGEHVGEMAHDAERAVVVFRRHLRDPCAAGKPGAAHARLAQQVAHAVRVRPLVPYAASAAALRR